MALPVRIFLCSSNNQITKFGIFHLKEIGPNVFCFIFGYANTSRIVFKWFRSEFLELIYYFNCIHDNILSPFTGKIPPFTEFFGK